MGGQGTARQQAHWGLAAAFTLLAGLALGWFAHTEQQRWEGSERTRIQGHLDSIRSRLEGSLNAPLLRTRGMAAQVVAHGDIDQAQFDTIAEYLLRDHRNVRNLAVSKGTVVAMTYPLAGNEDVLGVDYKNVPAQWPMVRHAIETHSPVLQGPVPLIQGGVGLIARLPVFLPAPGGGDGPFYGMVSILLDISSIMAEAGLDRADLPVTVAVRGRDGLGAAGEVIAGDEAVFQQKPVTMTVVLPHGSWQLAGIPKGGWAAAQSALGSTWLLIGAIFILVAMTAFGTARAMTQRADTERALRAKTADLERSNADLERFAYVASHDLQSPLRIVASYAQLLERRYRDRLDDDANDFIGHIVAGSTRMSRMVVDLLNFARVTSDHQPLSAVPARAALDEAVENLKGEIAASGAVLSVGSLPVVRAAPAQLSSVFQNLIGNAIKYAAADRAPVIGVHAERAPDGLWRFMVVDNGVGIEEQYYDKVFEFFERLHPPTERDGTGVGLAICRRILRRFGGEIWVESTPGEGSSFFFTLAGADG